MLDRLLAKRIIIKTMKSGRTYKTYVFECSKCKKEIRAQHTHLKTHSGKCSQCVQRGIPYKFIYNELISRANKFNNYKNDLTFEEFLELIKDPTCNYCNKLLLFNPHTRDDNTKHVSRAHQLDRKDNNQGYTNDNLVTCCWECNRLKSNIYTYEEFLKLSPILKQIQQEREKIKQ